MDSVLRPRDIQARIRSGESPETVAAAAQTTVEQIMPYASPVLAERAYVAQQAQRASVRRRTGEGAPGQLGAAVAQRLTAQEVDPEAVEWDAWRREDGRWTLVAEYAAAGVPERAEFVYDAAGRYVTATDDSSRRLVGERVGTAEPAPAVTDASQLHLGDDAIELVTGRRPEPLVEPPAEAQPPVEREPRPLGVVPEPPTPDPAPEPEPTPKPEPAAEAAPAEQRSGRPLADQPDEITVDLTEQAAAVRPARPATGDDWSGWMATQATERPPAPEPEALFDVPEPAAGDETGEPDPQAADEEQPKPKARPRSKSSKGRAAIPSWDEIMFGSSSAEK